MPGWWGRNVPILLRRYFRPSREIGWHYYVAAKINNYNNANEAINHGFALVTEERRSTGIYAYLDIGFNSLISNIRNYKNKVSFYWIIRG